MFSCWCMPFYFSACFVSFNLHVSICCVLVCAVCAAYAAYIFHIRSCVMFVMWCMDANAFPIGMITEPGTNNMKLGCRLCIAMRVITVITACFWGFPICSRRNRVRPFALRPFCASHITGGFFTFHTQTEDPSTYR